MVTTQDTQMSCQLQVVTKETRLTEVEDPQVNVQNPQEVQIVDSSPT